MFRDDICYFNFPPTAAAAIKNVPASILSGITEIFEIEFRDVTPFIVRVLVPIPEIFAPYCLTFHITVEFQALMQH